MKFVSNLLHRVFPIKNGSSLFQGSILGFQEKTPQKYTLEGKPENIDNLGGMVRLAESKVEDSSHSISIPNDPGQLD